MSFTIPVTCHRCGSELEAQLNRYAVLEVSPCLLCCKEKQRGLGDARPAVQAGAVLHGREQFEPGDGV